MLPIYLVVALLTLGGYVLFIPRYGMWAAAWLTVASEASIFLASWTVTQRQSPFKLDSQTILATIAASIVMGGTVWLLRLQPLAISIIFGAVTYTLALFALGGITKERLQQVLKPDAS